MALPSVGAHPMRVENVQVGGGYGSAPNGGMDVDGAGNAALDGDLTVDGSVQTAAFLGLGTPTTVTIASGAIAISQSHHLVETEGLAAADDLDTINGGRVGDLLVLRCVNSARKPTVKDNVGNIRCGGDFTLGTSSSLMLLIKQDIGWRCIAKINN